MTYPSSRDMLGGVTWLGTYIIWQQGVWVHCVDMKFSMSIIISSPHDLYDGGVRRQQDFFLLWKFLGEYWMIGSHNLCNVAVVGDGTIMVQRGYSLTLEDQEVLPLWNDSPLDSSIMIDYFGIWHVK